VEVAGLKIRGATFTFVAHVRNLATGDESVEVVGGRAGERKLRSFRPEQVYPWSARRTAKRAVSLADAPQLPLG